MRKFCILVSIFCLSVMNLAAQDNLRAISVTGNNQDLFERGGGERPGGLRPTDRKPQSVETPVQTETFVPFIQNASTVLSASSPIEGEYVLYRDIVRRYTWMEGLGEPITQEVASHLPYYFRLSRKNKAGHYQMVEALHGDTLTTNHPLSTYILDKRYDVSQRNLAWRERLLRIGQWILFSDYSGEKVLEERAYEAKRVDANLVYVMRVVQNDSNHVTISYLDSWGYPADMNEDPAFTYGSVVYVTYDSKGCDAVIDYLDGAGYRKKNTNGVDQTRITYDDHFRPLQKTSNNCVGDYTMDNWGNCGVQYKYKDDGSYSVVCINASLLPMRMPAIRADGESTFIRCDYDLDEWGRISQATFLRQNGRKDVTSSGIHIIRYHYSPDGTLVEKVYYDINGDEIQSL